MNIFVLDYKPKDVAQYHHDAHVRNQIPELLRVMHTARHNLGWPCLTKWIDLQHQRHPCVEWAKSSANYAWTWYLLYHLLEEHEFRFGTKHSCQLDLFHTLELGPLIPTFPKEFVQMMPSNYRAESPVLAYRQFYCGRVPHDVSWTRRGQPYWWGLYERKASEGFTPPSSTDMREVMCGSKIHAQWLASQPGGAASSGGVSQPASSDVRSGDTGTDVVSGGQPDSARPEVRQSALQKA